MDSSPDPVIKPEQRLIFLLGMSTIIGGILACLLTILIWKGWFERWEIVTQVPEKTIEVVYGDRLTAYIRTSEDKILRCSLYKPDECWIPYLLPDQIIVQPCEKDQVAFSKLLQPPSNLGSCVYTLSHHSVEADTIIYAVDQHGQLWRWAIIRNGGEVSNFMIMVCFGGFGGLMLGTLLWVAIRIIKNRKVSRKDPAFPRIQILILAAPWLCLLTFAIAQFIVFERPFQRTDNPNAALFTAVAETMVFRETQEALMWQQPLIIPSLGRVRYNFADHGCDAEWDADGKTLACYETEDTTVNLVRPFSLSPFSSFQSPGKALSLPTVGYKAVSGTYGVIELLEGDHFKTKIGCLDTSPECDVIFEVILLSEDQDYVILGGWQPGSGNQENVDIDLTKFSGRFVRFWFRSYGPNFQKSQQNAIWLMPRIENGF